MQSEVNYEALGRYTHLKQQRDTLQLRLQAMQAPFGTLQFMLENPYSNKSGRLRKSIDAVTAVLPEVSKIERELAEMTEEMAALAKKYNLGGNF